MKKKRLEKIFLEELAKVPNVSHACQVVKLSRQTIYRWRDEDQKFRKKMEQALSMGTDSVCDLAESKLIGNLREGSQRAIEYFLDRNKYKRNKKNIEEESDLKSKSKLNEQVTFIIKDFKKRNSDQ